MKTTVFMKPGQVAVKEVNVPKIIEKDDVILRVVRTLCLWIRLMELPWR